MPFRVMEVSMVPGDIPGAFGIGCTPSLDPESLHLVVGPGTFRLLRSPDEIDGQTELADELVFPGGELALPDGTIEVWIGRKRSDGTVALIVNVGKGIDNFTYEPAYPVYVFGTAHTGEGEFMERFPAHLVYFWRCLPRDRHRWASTRYGVPPDDLEQFRGDPVPVIVQSEIPEHIRPTIGRHEAWATALHTLGVLVRTPKSRWSDQTVREILLNLVIANPDVQLPDGFTEECS